MKFGLSTLCVAFFSTTPFMASAADQYPSDTIHVILRNPPGASADASSRIVADGLTQLTGQAVVVEPKPGAAGNIAAAYVARSKPDGYTVFVASIGTHGVNENIYKNLQYDPKKDFKSVSLIWQAPFYLYVNSKAPFDSVKSMVDYSKANPGKLNIGTTGPSDPSNIALLQFNILAGTNITAVPYQSAAAATQDVAAGRIDGVFVTASTATPLLEKLRPIGSTFNHTTPDQPEIPPISATLPGFELDPFGGWMVPANTPQDRVETLSNLVQKVLALPDVIEKFQRLGLEPAPTTPVEMTNFIDASTARITKVAKTVGIVPE